LKRYGLDAWLDDCEVFEKYLNSIIEVT